MAGKSIFVAIAASVFIVCSNTQGAPSSIQRIFQLETLGSRLQYFESLTGPAMHAYPFGQAETRDYRVEGCRVTAKVKDGNISALGLDMSPRCNFNLGAFLGNGYGPTNGLTVGRFAQGSFGGASVEAHSGCIYLCGNAADPVVSFVWEGPHAVNFVTLVLNVVLASPQALTAVSRWQDSIKRSEGQAFIEQTRFNCTRKYDAEALRNFSEVAVNNVTIGFDIAADTYSVRECGRR